MTLGRLGRARVARRWLRSGLWALLAAGVLLGPVGAEPVVTVLEESDDGLLIEVAAARPAVTPVAHDSGAYLRVALPGWERPATPGVPDLPFTELRIALPPGRAASVRVEPLAQERLATGRPVPVPLQQLEAGSTWEPQPGLPRFSFEYRPDPAHYAGAGRFPRALAELGRTHRWRHLRVAPIRVAAVQFDAAAGELVWFPRLRVHVVFAPQAEGRDRLSRSPAYTPAEPHWESIYRRTLLNYERARAYRTRPAVRALPRAPRPQAQYEFRVAVDTLGIYRVTFADLQEAGLPVAELDWTQLRMAVRGFDDEDESDPFREWPIDFLREDHDGDGFFEAGEGLVFLGEDRWDFFDLTGGGKRYGRGNVYWILYGAEPGSEMASDGSWFDWPGLFPLISHRRTQHFETDLYYMTVVALDDTRGSAAGPEGIKTDHYNWTYPGASRGSEVLRIRPVAFDLPALFGVDSVCVHLQGQGYVGGQTTGLHKPRLWLARSADPADTAWAFPGNPYTILSADDHYARADVSSVPATVIGQGRNYAKIYLPEEGDGIDNVNGSGIGIDWVEVTYRGKFEMRNHRLFAELQGQSGRTQLLIRRLESQDIYLFDLTDPRHPVRLEVDPSQFTPHAGTGTYDLKLQVECPAPPATMSLLCVERDYLDRPAVGGIRLRGEAPLTAFAGEDFVCAYPRVFGSAIEPLLQHRESQGHKVLRAPIEAVYDTYSGGRDHPFALKRLMRYMWRESVPSPDYLLLAGDGSTDIAQYMTHLSFYGSDTSRVPTITIPGHYFGATGTELVSSDHWFVDGLGDPWGDPLSFTADVHIGRIPADTAEQLADFVAKQIAYETDAPTAAWRRRLLFVSDDDFSSTVSGIGGGVDYRRRSSEDVFAEITRDAMDMVRTDSLFADFTVDSLLLNAAMDTVAALGRCVPDSIDPNDCQLDSTGNIVRVGYGEDLSWVLNRDYGQTIINAQLEDMLNRGVLLWAYQGHSNRTLMAHEYIFQNWASFPPQDVDDLQNIDKPFIFLGFGCHLAQFAYSREGDDFRIGEGAVEQMMFCCDGSPRGAIAVLASTDYEVIGHRYEESVLEAMFADPPLDVDSDQLRWRLGEIVTHSKAKVPTTRVERLTYTLLGDPALRIGVTPPAIYLTLNGEPWDSETTTEYATSREDDSLLVRIDLRDESSTDWPAVEDYFGPVPSAQLDPVDELDERGGRRVAVYYRTQVQRQPYELTITAYDYDGAARETRLQFAFATALFEQVGEDLQPLEPGTTILSTAELAATVRCAAHLQPEDVRLLANGTAVPQRQAEVDAVSGAPDSWTIRFETLPQIEGEEVELELQVAQYDGSWRTMQSQAQSVGIVAMGLDGQPAWVPNPFTGETHLVYRLTASGSRARLRIYTASGRKIVSDETLSAAKGTRYYRWDGRDKDGDPVANGLYFYDLTIWDVDGREIARVVDKVVRAR